MVPKPRSHLQISGFSRSGQDFGTPQVIDLKGQRVSGALLYALGVPYNLVKEVPEVRSDSSGYATITLYPTSSFPKTGTLQIFVRVRRGSDPDLLTGVSNRRLIQVTIKIP